MKYQVEYAKFVNILDDDYIEKHGEVEPPDYQVWNEARPI